MGLGGIPKRPGQMPPFAVFSRENRPKVTEANPDMPFPDVGRMLGEMWHNLTHEEKEEYRDDEGPPPSLMKNSAYCN